MKYNVLTFILAFLLSACSVMEDYGDDCPGQEEDEAGLVTLSFKLISSSIVNSRSDIYHDEVGSEWSAFEDQIQADDFAFFIFCQQEDGTWPLVLKMTNIKNSTDPNMMITGAAGLYTVTAVISKDKLGHDVTLGSNKEINFRMVVLANTGAANKYDDLDTTSYDDFIEAASKWKIGINTIYQADVTSDAVDKLFVGGIPMFGLKEFKFTESALYSSRPEERLWIGDIYMLRALSKIKVVDAITNKTDSGLPRIESVTFQGGTLDAYVLPYNKGEYKDGYQVETANPAPAPTEGIVTPMRLGYITPNAGTVLGYIPEQNITTELPTLTITITYEVDANNVPTLQETFEVPLWGYKGETFNLGDAILRNHIYTLSVDLEHHELFCTVTLFPYTAVILNPLFGFSVPVQSIHIVDALSDPVTSSEVAVGQSVSLGAYVLPEDANDKTIIWSSDHPEIATVTKEGLVTAVSVGTATITATSAEKPAIKATCMITVKAPTPVRAISLTLTTWIGNIGETVNLTPIITPADATNKNIIWTSSDDNVATVSPYGTVTAENQGTATITATPEDRPDLSATCTVTVNKRVLVSSITLVGTQPTNFYQGDQFSLTPTVLPATATNQELTWTSSNTNVATVSSYGLVTAVTSGNGSAVIRATAKDGSGKSATYSVTVKAKTAVTGLSISPSTWTTTANEVNPPKKALTLNFTPANATNKSVIWTSSDPSVVTVNSPTSTTITAKSRGTATITATSVDNPNVKATCRVTVN